MLIEVLPIIAALLYTWAYRTACGKKFSYICIFATLIYGVYYYAHEAFSALISIPIYVVYTLATLKLSKSWVVTLLVGYIAFLFGGVALAAENTYELIPAFAASMGALSHYYQRCIIRRKSMALCSLSLWSFFGFYIGGPGMALTFGLIALSTLQSVIKDYIELSNKETMIAEAK